MEYIVAAFVVLLTVIYAVVIAVNVEKGREWALEIARAVAMLDPQSINCELRTRAMESPVVDAAPKAQPEPETDRLAA